jgi:hypothetical protein
VHTLDAADYEANTLIESEPEAGHAGVGDGDASGFALLAEQRDDASAAADDVPIADTTEAGAPGAGVSIGLDEQFFGNELSGSVEVRRIDGLIGAEGENVGDTGVERGVDDVAGSIDIGLDRFDGIVFTGGHLLKRGGMDNDVHLLEGATQADAVSNVSDEVAKRWMVEAGDPHFMLLQLITAEDNELLRVKFTQHDLGEFFTE